MKNNRNMRRIADMIDFGVKEGNEVLDQHPMYRLVLLAYLIILHVWLLSYYFTASEASPTFLG